MKIDRGLLFLIILALITRFFMLDARPMDHDESIHAYLSYVLLKYHYYSYDPAFHGPFLYFMTAGLFYIFGDSEFVARLTPVAFSILAIYIAYKFKRWIGNNAYVFAFIMLFSPSILYYSRYLRNDIILIASFLTVVYCYFRYLETKKDKYIYLAVLFFTIMLCSKENAYIYLFIFISFIFLELIYKKGLNLNLNLHLLNKVAISAIIFCSLFIPLYTAGFSDWSGIKKATIGAVEHWLEMHEIKDHWKPIHYYAKLIITYEFMPLILTIFAIPYFIKQRNKLAIFAFYWLIMSLIIYHILSHKVPWLLLHIVTPMALFGSIYVDKLSKPILAILAISTIAVSFYVTYIDYNDAVNQDLIYIQVQPSAVELAKKIIEISNSNYSIVIYEPNNDYWPLPWYLRHYQIPFTNKYIEADYIVTSERVSIKEGEIIGRYEIRPFYYMVLIKMH